MTPQRFEELMGDETLSLTKEEAICGWHFCPDWDGLLKMFDETCPCDIWTTEELESLSAGDTAQNAKSQATDAALSRQVACTDGLCVKR